MEPLIVNLVPSGLVLTRAQSPHVALTAEEVTADYVRSQTGQRVATRVAEDAAEEFRCTELTVMTILSSGEGLGFVTHDWRSKWGALGLALLATPSDLAWAGNRASLPSMSIFHHHVH